METKTEEIAQLIRETARAHHAYQEEVFGGEYQKNWHPWYADRMLANGLEGMLGGPVTKETLAEMLAQCDREYGEQRPDIKWPDYYAQRLVESMGP